MQQVELQRMRRDGSRYTTVSFKSPIMVDQVALVGIFSIVRDVTVERENRLALEDAVRTVKGHNRELEEFAFVASHDLQEPLRKVRAFGRPVRLHLDSRADAESLDYIERMRAAAERMQRLIDDLLAYSRVAKRDVTPRRLELREVLAGVLADLETSIEQKQAEVVSSNLPSIDADETQMRQLLQNLISNALKFVHVGRPPRIAVHGEVFWPESGFDRRPWVRIVVADNGIGFDNKYAERIFAAFQRLHGQREYSGSGIGLAIVRRIVERHGGHIRAEGKLGEGATFVIEIPQHGREWSPCMPTKPQRPTHERDRKNAGPRCDGRRRCRRLHARRRSVQACPVDNPLHCLYDGEKLIDYLRHCVAQSSRLDCFPALILLDLNMPRMDGRETLQMLKADPMLKDIPVVVWTTSRSEDDVRRAKSAGCDDYIIKPSSFTEMVGIVRNLGERWLGGHSGALA